MRRTEFYPQLKFFKVFCFVLLLVTCLFSTASLLNVANAAEVTLAWDANSEENLDGYKLYYKLDSSGTPYNGTGLNEGDSPVTIYLEDMENSSSPQFTLTGLGDGQIYFFALTAFDTDGMESDFSDEVSYEVPSTLPNEYTIAASTDGQGGSIIPAGSIDVTEGASQTFSIVADANYSISNVVVDGSSVGPVSMYSFENVSVSHTIEAVFAPDVFTVTATAGDGGTISPEGTTTAAYGTSLGYTITPAVDYHIADVFVDGESIGAVAAYTFEAINTPHTIEAVFEHDTVVFTITATSGNGGTISPTGVTSTVSGSSLSYTITPDANCHIANVMVDGVSVGPVTAYTFNSINASHTIEVVFALDIFTVTATAGDGGRISPEGTTSAAYGESLSYTITPDANHHIVRVLVDGSSVGQVSAYTFGNITAAHTIEAVFEIDTFTVTAVSGGNGTITPSGIESAAYGSSLNYAITPDANYHIANVMVDGASVGAVDTYRFESIINSHTIEAVFEIDGLSITAVSGDGGTISPAGVTNADFGSSVSYTISPDANHHILEVMVDGSSVGQVNAYTLDNITTAHTIEAVFEINTFTITATAGPDGTITPEGIANAADGSNQRYTITPTENHHIADVMVDGASVGAVSTYTFEDIDASHTIEAVFEIDTFSIVASASENGAVSPEGAIEVAFGVDQVFTMVPNSGYVIEDVIVDGDSVGAVAEYAFSNIAADHTLEAVFAEAIPGFALETGSVAVGDGWRQVSFERTFADPVVVAATRNMDMVGSLVIRINNVTETGFEISAGMEAATDTTEKTIDYVVMEAGSFTLPDGTVLEADTIVTEDITGVGSHAFVGDFSEVPEAGASIVTCSNPEALAATLSNVSPRGVDYQLSGQDTDGNGYLSEMVSVIAMEKWQSPLSATMVAAGITEEMMTFSSEVITCSQPSVNGIDTGTSGGGTDTSGGDSGSSGGDTGSSDGDTTTPEDDTGGAGQGNHSPTRPVPMSDNIEVSGVGPVVLSLEAFNDPDSGDYHLATEWQVFQAENDICIVGLTSPKALTEFDIAPILLEPSTRYVWRARFVDNNSGVSEWSETAYFVTGNSETDLNGNGIPDTQEAGASVDMNGDEIPDLRQDNVKSLVLPGSNTSIGLAIEDAGSSTEIVSVEAVVAEELKVSGSHKRRIRRLPYGLINFKLLVAEPGDTALVTVYFSEPVSRRAKWIKLDVVNDTWLDYSGYTQFSRDRMSAVIELVDGGYGDDDGVANGIIVDPAGLELADLDEASVADASVSDSGPAGVESSGVGCFIIGAVGDTSPVWPVGVILFFLLCGAVLMRFRGIDNK